MSDLGDFGSGSSIDLVFGTALALGAAGLVALSGFSLKWSVDLAQDLSEFRDYQKDTLEVFSVVVGMVVCNLVAGPTIALIGYAHGEPVISSTLGLGLLGGAVLSAATGILWRKANLMSGDLGINVISYITPLLSLGWLFALSLVGNVDVILLFFGAILIVAANGGVYAIARHEDQVRASTLRQIERRRAEDLIAAGESHKVEFKSTLRMNINTQRRDRNIELAATKTLAAFLNTDGGTLVIGVSDDHTPIGVEMDEFQNEDRMSLHLRNIVDNRMGAVAMSYIHPTFDDFQGVRVMVVRCEPSKQPVYVTEGQNTEKFYIRTGPSTTALSIREANSYINDRF